MYQWHTQCTQVCELCIGFSIHNHKGFSIFSSAFWKKIKHNVQKKISPFSDRFRRLVFCNRKGLLCVLSLGSVVIWMLYLCWVSPNKTIPQFINFKTKPKQSSNQARIRKKNSVGKNCLETCFWINGHNELRLFLKVGHPQPIFFIIFVFSYR